MLWLGHAGKKRLGCFAAEAQDPAWNYESLLQIHRRIEDWNGSA